MPLSILWRIPAGQFGPWRPPAGLLHGRLPRLGPSAPRRGPPEIRSGLRRAGAATRGLAGGAATIPSTPAGHPGRQDLPELRRHAPDIAGAEARSEAAVLRRRLQPVVPGSSGPSPPAECVARDFARSPDRDRRRGVDVLGSSGRWPLRNSRTGRARGAQLARRRRPSRDLRRARALAQPVRVLALRRRPPPEGNRRFLAP